MGIISKSAYLASLVAVAVASAFIYQKRKKDRIPSKWEQVGTVKRLNIYPLKSGHRIELQKAECTEFGLKQTAEDEKVLQLRDRSLVVYGERDFEFRTARTYPKMVLIDVSVHDGEHLAIDAPTMRTLYVKIPSKEDYKQMKIKWHLGEEVQGIDCGDEAAAWFSRYILEMDSGLRLAYNDASKRRDITKTHKFLLDYYKNLSNEATGLFSDLTSVMIVNQASVNDLVKKIGGTDITIDNFRPNIVVDGNIEPYSEDDWDWIKIGDVVLRNVKECTRCILTTVNPENGTRDPQREPLKTLETYRMSVGPKKQPVMGNNYSVRQTGFISVGDKVFYGKSSE